MNGNQNSVDNNSNMYSYREDPKDDKNNGMDAIPRSIPKNNNKKFPINDIQPKINYPDPGTITVYIDQSPPPYWMFFIVFAIIQVILILLIGFYYNWDDYYTNPRSIYNYTNNTFNETIDDKSDTKGGDVYMAIENKYKLFQEVNIMILLGFGFLNSFLKHYSWTGVAITIIGLVLSTEFGLFMLICWRAIFSVDWNFGRFNFQHLLDANLCGASVIISLGAVLGKISMPQYLIFFLTETIGVTFNYTLLRQVIKIIDIGGALTVHLFGAIYGCIYSFISFYSKNERERIRLSPHLGSSYYSNVFAFFGSLIMLSYFPAFNTCLLDDDLYRPNDQSDLKPKYDGMINTYLSILGSIIGTFSMSPIFNEGKFLTDDILHSCYAGGIVVAGCCHLITHYWVPLLFGFFTGMLTCFLKNLFSEKLKLCGYHDTTNALFYHGVPGFVGGILTTIFVGNMPNLIEIKQKSYIYKYIGTFLSYYSNYDDFGTDDVKFGKYAGIHFAAIFITIGVALAFGFLAGFTIKFCNCNIAMRYFNDSEFFDVTDCDRFPWRDENIRVVLNYNPRN